MSVGAEADGYSMTALQIHLAFHAAAAREQESVTQGGEEKHAWFSEYQMHSGSEVSESPTENEPDSTAERGSRDGKECEGEAKFGFQTASLGTMSRLEHSPPMEFLEAAGAVSPCIPSDTCDSAVSRF